ncbi:SmpA / OmlA family protein [Beggiatoa sp. PS]|nr:SmpA / OmlA family protein [Beggiatoa sp. PS]
MMRKELIWLCFFSTVWFLSSSGCAVYKIDIRQGNLVTQEMLARLELNMPAKKVRLIMGTPLLVDVFHQNRWDYLYSFQPGGGQRTQRHISLYFDNNQLLAKIDGDIKIGKPRPQKPVTPPVPDEDPIL